MDVELAPFTGKGSGVDAILPSTSKTPVRPGRRDGRSHNEMRPLVLHHSPQPHADGSARLQQGGTDVLVSIHGPFDAPLTKQNPDTLHIHVTHRRRDRQHQSAQNSSSNSTSTSLATSSDVAATASEAVSARMIRTLVSDVLSTTLFPRKALTISIHILVDKGSTTSIVINATTLALLNASIPMRTLPIAATISLSNSAITVDPTAIEQAEADAVITSVFDVTNNTLHTAPILSISTDGNCSGEHMFNAAIHTCRQLSYKTREFISQSLDRVARRPFVWNSLP